MNARDRMSTLPTDVLYIVAAHITPEVVMRLGKACRALHTLTEGMLSVVVGNMSPEQRTDELALVAGKSELYSRVLLQQGAQADARDNSLLISAAWSGHLEVCRLLLHTGAQADAQDSYALLEAAGRGHIDVCRLLLEQGARADARDSQALVEAAWKGHLEVCRMLLHWGARADAQMSQPLVDAAEEGHHEVCRLLLEWGAHA
jgi:ankyrin repeat protein